MPDAKVTGLGSLTGANVANGDAVMIVDVSDMTMAGTGTNKRITADELAQMPQLSSRYVSKTEDDNMWVSASTLSATVGTPTLVRLTTSPAWSLDDSTNEAVITSVYLPEHWATFHVDLWIYKTTANAGDVVWESNASSDGNGDTIGLDNYVTATIAAPAQNAIDVQRVQTGRSNTAGKIVSLYLGRLGGNGADTLTGDITLMGAMLVKAS